MPSCTHLNGFFFSLPAKKSWNFLCFDLKKEPYVSQILLKLWLIGNRTLCHPIWSVIILVIKQIGLDPLCGRPILLITRMITDWIGLPSVLLPLLIFILFFLLIIIIVIAVVDIDINIIINIRNEITDEVRSCNYL